MLDYLSNPEDPRYLAAMKHACGLCGAKPNRPCWNIVAVDGAPLPHRLIHSYRIPPEALKGHEPRLPAQRGRSA